jgi:hypothetical protein
MPGNNKQRDRERRLDFCRLSRMAKPRLTFPLTELALLERKADSHELTTCEICMHAAVDFTAPNYKFKFRTPAWFNAGNFVWRA